MSFFSGLLGGKTDKIVDETVDKVAIVAKNKVKEMMGGGAAAGAGGAAAGGGKAPAAAGGGKAPAAPGGGKAPAAAGGAGGGIDVGGVAAGAMDAFSGMFSADDKKEKKPNPSGPSLPAAESKPSSGGGELDLADSLDF